MGTDERTSRRSGGLLPVLPSADSLDFERFVSAFSRVFAIMSTEAVGRAIVHRNRLPGTL